MNDCPAAEAPREWGPRRHGGRAAAGEPGWIERHPATVRKRLRGRGGSSDFNEIAVSFKGAVSEGDAPAGTGGPAGTEGRGNEGQAGRRVGALSGIGSICTGRGRAAKQPVEEAFRRMGRGRARWHPHLARLLHLILFLLNSVSTSGSACSPVKDAALALASRRRISSITAKDCSKAVS